MNDLAARWDAFAARKRLAFLDIDGTLGLDEAPFPGSRAFLDDLTRRGIRFYLLTNNSSKGRDDYLRKVAKMGFEVGRDQILISTDGLIAHLRAAGISEVFAVGTPGMIADLAEAGIRHRDDSMTIAMGYDTTLDYAKIRAVALRLQRGATFLVTHPDFTCPSREGPLPDTGAFMAMFETATGRRPDRVFGKPNREMIDHVIARHGLTVDDSFMVGDRLYTDFQMSLNAGVDFVCVLSGEATAESLAAFGHEPALTAPSVAHLIAFRP